jgi:hypothetical protein
MALPASQEALEPSPGLTPQTFGHYYPALHSLTFFLLVFNVNVV